MPEMKNMADNKKELAVKILLGAIQYASQQLVELDDEFKQKIAGISAIIQWKITDGPMAYTIVEDGKIDYKMDAEHDSPTYTIQVSDLDIAMDMLQGKLSATEALEQGKIEITGDLNAATQQTFILEDLAKYLVDLRG